MKAAKFFSICEIVCFVGLALSYAGEFLCAFVAQGTDKDIFQMGLFLFWLLIGPLAICNLICAAVMYRRLSDPAVRQTLWRCIIAMKCIAIPMFLLNFFFGMIYGMFTLIFPMTLPVVLLQILVAWFAMMASSGYCIALILHTRRQGKISTGTAVLQVISQFIYVVDVISLFFIRKTVKECETTQEVKKRSIIMQFDPTLYVITDSTYHTTETLLHAVDEACRGGATLIQLREKDTGGRSYLELAQQVKAVTDRYNVPLIIDDRVDVAIACDAAGVHVGASDLPVAVCRRLLGPDKIVGATAKTVEAAVAAYNDGADYLGTGAIYPTTTHVTTKVTPVSVLNDVCRAVPIPVVAIGGLNADNMDVLADSPIKGIAVVSAVMKADDPCAAAAQIKEKFLKMMNK